MHGLRRRLSEPRMAGQLPADRSANQRVTAAGDSFLCMRMCDIKHTYKQSKKRVKTEPVENSRNAGFYVLSWFLRQKLASTCPLCRRKCLTRRFVMHVPTPADGIAAQRHPAPPSPGYAVQRIRPYKWRRPESD